MFTSTTLVPGTSYPGTVTGTVPQTTWYRSLQKVDRVFVERGRIESFTTTGSIIEEEHGSWHQQQPSWTIKNRR